MIVWIDGTYGVGKTSVAIRLEEIAICDKIEFLESDVYFRKVLKELVDEAIKENRFPGIGGVFPQNNRIFIDKFKWIIQEKLDEKKIVIVDMALTSELCKKLLYDFFQEKGIGMLHIILNSTEEIIKSRIKDDNARDVQGTIENLQCNILFLNQNYPDAIKIDTSDRSIDDVANEITKLVKTCTGDKYFI